MRKQSGGDEKMTENELREAATCSMCGNKIMAGGILPFWRVTIERYSVDLNAVWRQAAVEMLLGGHIAIAQVLEPGEELTRPMMEPKTMTVCETCGTKNNACIAVMAMP
jgi:hypothetical protein